MDDYARTGTDERSAIEEPRAATLEPHGPAERAEFLGLVLGRAKIRICGDVLDDRRLFEQLGRLGK